MRNLIKLLLLATTIYVFHMTASAQTQTDRPTETTDASTSAHWLFTLSLGQVFNSNILTCVYVISAAYYDQTLSTQLAASVLKKQ